MREAVGLPPLGMTQREGYEMTQRAMSMVIVNDKYHHLFKFTLGNT